jgi:saccharopine dehydrogenase-like NADP-dependent oxidoreductase
MSNLKHIVLFGAGKSATVLIEYLKEIATENIWQVIVADANLESAQSKVGEHALVKAVAVNIENENERRELIEVADVVISLMPAQLHYLLALDCIALNKHLLTASYVDGQIESLKPEIEKRKLLFLCEMGLDPGIDHMSAMQLFNRIKREGGTVTSFKSHCGGLVAPESDDNPWHYKISWNPRNIVMAGKSGAQYKEKGSEVRLKYQELFNAERIVTLPDGEIFAYYPNRDSLHYLDLYDLHKVDTFMRTTLRHPEFCFGWKNIVDLRLTDDEKIYQTDGLSFADFFRQHFEKHGFGEWLNNMLTTRLSYATEMMQKLMQLIEAEKEAADEGVETDEEIMMIDEKGDLTTIDVEDVKDKAAESVAYKMHEANLSMKQLFYLGLDDETLINKGLCSAADVLQVILEKKLALQPRDKDMVVMMHEIEYEVKGIKSNVKSTLVVKGENSFHTAMAKTVGLPLGIAAKLIIEEKIKETGLHIPVSPSIYQPVLKELEKHGIIFHEA